MIQPSLINLHPREYRQEFHYNLFTVKLDKCVGSCNTLNGLSNKVCVPNKTEDLNLSMFNIITWINESKTLTKHISCEYKCTFDGRKCNWDQWWNNDKCQCEYKKCYVWGKGFVWNPVTLSCENGKYLVSVKDDSAIICDEIIEQYNKTNFNWMKATCKMKSFYIFLAFLLITITLLIAVSAYSYLIKYRAIQEHLLPFHLTNNKLKI